MMNVRTILMLTFITILLACEESANIPLSTQATNLIVVEGMITSENTTHLIKITHPHLNQNDTSEPVSGAIVTVTDGTITYNLKESSVSLGEYYTPIMRAVTGTIYKLFISVNGKSYTAEDSPVPVSAMPAIQYFKTNDQYELVLNSVGDDAGYINHDISWKNTPMCTSGSCESKVVFYDLKNIDVNEIFKPKKEELTFPGGSTITRTKYSLSAAYRSYLRSMLSETEWHGGVFDSQRANVTTNLSEGAVGFFATCTTISETTVIPE